MNQPADIFAIPEAITLSQLTTLLGNALRMEPRIQQVWVTAELSDVRTSGGHCYLELVEKNSSGNTVAKIRANIWSSTYRVLSHKFYAATGSYITSGIKVMLRGSVTHHNVYGVAFNVTDIDPTYTLGDMERKRREILEQLKKDGLLERNSRTYMPMNPQRVAVISAAGAAGYGDFCNQLDANSAGYKFYTHLFPAVMQGERTETSVIGALEMVMMTVDLWDCVVIIRGGGATTDLNGFDSLEIGRAIALCPIPVITGIGHERDTTVPDYVAYKSCKTPTAVAEYLLETLRTADTTATNLVRAIMQYSTQRLRGEWERLSAAASMVPAQAQASLRQASLRFSTLLEAIPRAVSSRLALASQRLDYLGSAAASASSARTAMERSRLDTFPTALTRAAEVAIARQNERLSHISSLITVLSPQATLRRGYSITRVDGKAVTSAADLKSGTRITTVFADGSVSSTVDKP